MITDFTSESFLWGGRTQWSNEDYKHLHAEMMVLHRAPRDAQLKPVAWVKSKLGTQHYTWVGEFRFWIWETDMWRLYVSNKKGICFETKLGLTQAEKLAAWDDLRQQLGLK